ncbi:hypothetical protein [Paenibacillus sp. JCM 10914]|uniref:hypothetical protein n=1 Tax=Paenibacillus sp. JCM 10914 TaxID=1236974 RepID=UPI0003CC7C3A|nr:hypothetical protein [Paenibacillus sp. JCM 10914]GAE07687.1 hypothetical protein JCM10914_3929 [Paenibacillus sp. JCM 10914]
MNSKWKITLISATVLTMLAGASIYQVSADPVPDASSSQVSDEQPFQTSSGTAAGHAGQGANQTSAQDEIKMDLAAENEFLALYFNPETTEIAVRIKKDGSVWFSNPQAREQDGKASGFNKAMLSSQLLLSYSDSSGKPQQYNNFSQSVQYQQFVHEKLEDGIKITYTVGEKLRGVEQVPPFIGEERFQMLILDKIQDEKVKSDMLNRFKLNEKKKAYERRDKALNGWGLRARSKYLKRWVIPRKK